MNPTPIPATEPSFPGLRFALLSQVARVTDAALERIATGCTLILADVCADYRLAPCGFRILSDVSELRAGEILTTYEENIGDPSAAAFHTFANGAPVIRIAAGAGTVAADWENDSVHEGAETLGDADVATFKVEQRADGTMRFHAFELCDRTQGAARPLDIGSGDPFNAANVLLSAYWQQQPAVGARLDLQGVITAPFQLGENSYGVYVMGTGGEQQEASGNLAARRVRAMAPQDRVVVVGQVPADKFMDRDSRFLRRVACAHAFARSL